ncbi:hypothetical protein B0H34DRAFT_713608 [Crassisporium funariophilum]|nr:hypothetical protein B0H34DRAFT_713608 [Crassisporium funariophilum]
MNSVASVYQSVLLPSSTLTTDASPTAIDDDAEVFRIDKFLELCVDRGIPILEESEFSRDRILGAGATMSVYDARWNSKAQQVALKFLNATPPAGASSALQHDAGVMRILRSAAFELQVMTHYNIRSHHNVVNILAVSWEQVRRFMDGIDIYPILVVELADKQYPTLHELILGKVALGQKLEILRDIVEGMNVLHEHFVVHGDLKPQNILMFRSLPGNYTAKISDFGFSTETSRQNNLQIAGGTEYWNAPECLQEAPQHLLDNAKSKERDIYSYGIVASFILLDELPFRVQSDSDRIRLTSLKLQDKFHEIIASLWRLKLPNDESKVLTLFDVASISPRAARTYILEVFHDGAWRQSETTFIEFILLLPQMLRLQPLERPGWDSIRTKLVGYTRERVLSTHSIENKGIVNLPRVFTSVTGKSNAVGLRFSSLVPEVLRTSLLQHFIQVSGNSDTRDSIDAMVNLGYYHTKAFGVDHDLLKAMTWFIRAACAGSRDAKDMVFRLERLFKKTVVELSESVTSEMRVSWMVECLLRDMSMDCREPEIPTRIMDLQSIQEDMTSKILSIDAQIVEDGLARAVDDDVVRVLALVEKDYSNLAIWKRSPGLWEALSMDDVHTVNTILSTATPRMFLSETKRWLLMVSVEVRAHNVLANLVRNHGISPEEIVDDDTVLLRALKRSHSQAVHLLLNLNASWEKLMIGRISQEILVGASNEIVHVICSLLGRISINTDPPYDVPACFLRAILDGMDQSYMTVNRHASEFGMDRQPVDNDIPPLFKAIAFNRIHSVRALLAFGANPNVYHQGMSALHLASRMLRPLIVWFLLAYGADPNSRSFQSQLQTPLHQLSGGHMLAQKNDEGVYFRSFDGFGDPFIPMPKAKEEDHAHRKLIASLLLAYGADPCALDSNNFTPLSNAIASPEPQGPIMARFFMAKGAMFLGPYAAYTTLHAAIAGRKWDLFKELLKTGNHSLMNGQERAYGVTPLMFASSDDLAGYAQKLLSAGADLSVRNILGETALVLAIKNKEHVIFRMILSHLQKLSSTEKQDILSRNPVTGQTPAHVALVAIEFLREVLPLLSDINEGDRFGMTVLHHAVIQQNVPAVRLILAHSGNTHQRGYKDMSPLHLAHAFGNKVILNLLNPQAIDVSQTPSMTSAWNSIMRHNPITTTHLQYDLAFLLAREHELRDSQQLDQEKRATESWKYLRGSSQYHPGDRFGTLSPLEVGHEKLVEACSHQHGKRHAETLWSMNFLGLAYERYGRVIKAFDINKEGWELCVQVLGPADILTQDFANKLLRLMDHIGSLSDEKGQIEQWIALHGSQTLKPSRFVIKEEPIVENWELAGKTAVLQHENDVPEHPCDGHECKKVAVFQCSKCKLFEFCSKACQEKKPVHQPCIVSQALNTHPGVIRERLLASDTYARTLTTNILNFILAGSRLELSDCDGEVPSAETAHMVYCLPGSFNVPLHFRTTKNMSIGFMTVHKLPYEYANVLASPLVWQTPRTSSVQLLFEETNFIVRPTSTLGVDNETEKARSTLANRVPMFVMVKWTKVDFKTAFEKKAKRLNGSPS